MSDIYDILDKTGSSKYINNNKTTVDDIVHKTGASFYIPGSPHLITMADVIKDKDERNKYIDAISKATWLRDNLAPDASVEEMFVDPAGTMLKYGIEVPISGKTKTKSIIDSIYAGALTVKQGFIGMRAWIDALKMNYEKSGPYQYENALGDTVTFNKKPNKEAYQKAKESLERNERELNYINNEMSKLLTDVTDHPIWVEYVKTLAQLAPYTAVLGSASVIEGVTAGFASPIVAAMVSAASFAATTSILTGSAYSTLRSNNIDVNTAALIAPVIGSINNIIERSFGMEESLRNIFTKDVAKDVAGKLVSSGFLTKFAVNTLKTSISESVEESAQTLVESLGGAIAELMSDTVPIQNTKVKDVALNVAQSFFTTLITTPVLSIPGNLFTTIIDMNRAKAILEAAKTAKNPKEVKPLIENIIDQNALKENNISIDDVAEALYNKAMDDKRKEIEAKYKAIMRGEISYDEQAKEVRLDNGKLASDTSVEGVGSEDSILLKTSIYDPISGREYINLTYDIKDNSVLINDADIKNGYEHLVVESLFRVADETGFNVRDIKASENANPYIIGAIESIKKNAVPSSYKLSDFRYKLESIGFDEYQKELATNLVVAMAKSVGKSVDNFLEPLVDISRSSDITEGRITISDIAGETKSIIELSEKGDALSLTHELAHFYRIHNKELFTNLETEYGIKNGNWSTEHEERFVNDFINYLREPGKASKNENVFTRLANFIKSVWNNISGISNDKVKAFFDETIGPYIENQNIISKHATDHFTDEVSQYSVKPEDIASRTDNITKKERYLNGEWRRDPQLVAEFKRENNIPLNTSDKMVLDMVDELSAIDGVSKDKIVLYMSDRQMETLHKNNAYDAKQYDSFEKWVNAIKESNPKKKLSDDVIAKLKERYDWVHNDKKEQGMSLAQFKKLISDNKNIVNFIKEALANKEALGNHPFLYTFIEKLSKSGRLITSEDVKKIQRYIGMNDAFGMYLYGNVVNDNFIKNSALDIMAGSSAAYERMLVKRNRLPTITSMRDTIMSIKNSDIRDKIISKTITAKELNDYIKTLKDRIKEDKEAVTQAKELYKIQANIGKLKDYIMRRPKHSIDVFYQDSINIIRKMLKSSSKEDSLKDIESLKSFKPLAYAMNKDVVLSSIERTLEETNGNLNINALSLQQLEEIAKFRKGLEKEGAILVTERRNAYSMYIESLRLSILNDLPKAESQNILKNIDLVSSPFNVIVDRYLGKRANDILTKKNIETLTKWLNDYNNRVAPIENYITDKGLAIKLQRQITIENAFGLNNKESVVYTASDLLGAYYLVGIDESHENKHQQLTYIYNNLMGKEERMEMLPYIQETAQTPGEFFESYVAEKVNIIRDAAKKYLTKEELELGKMIHEIINTEENYLRLANALYNLTGKEFGPKESFYFPLKMTEPVENIADNFVQDLKGMGFEDVWQPGFIYERTKGVSPFHGSAVETDIFKVFTQSVWQQEFLVNRGQYVKDILYIFKSNNIESKAIRERIETILGEKGLEALDNYIREISMPNSYREKGPEDQFLGMLRSSFVISTLAFRYTVLLNQLLTSITPVLFDAKIKHVSSVIAESITKNPVKWYREMETKYGVLKNRQRTILDEVIDKETKNEVLRKIRSLGIKGMDITSSFPDRYITAICFEAVRRTELEKTNNESKAEIAATKHILETQPTSLTMFRSPLYQRMGGFKAIALLFTYPYNVMWQLVRHKIPLALKRHELNVAIKGLLAIAITGVAQGFINILRGRGPEDDKDKQKYLVHSIPESVIEYIPLVGSPLGNLYYSAVVGGGSSGKFSDTYPILDDSIKVIQNLSKGDTEKAAIIGGESVARLLWLPVGAAKEYYNLFRSTR